MIRIGILLDSLTIQAWQVETIRQILNTGLAEVPLLIVNQRPKPSGNPSPFLYKVYRKIDRILFKSNLDAFSFQSIFSVLDKDTNQLLVTPVQKKFSDYLSDEDIYQIKSQSFDILLRFGFRIMRGEILKSAKFGVWSFHHADPRFYRGGPPGFWEVMKQNPLNGTVLMKLSEELDQGEILYQSWTQTDPLSVQRNANRIFWKSAFFPARVLQKMVRLGYQSKPTVEIEDSQSGPLWKPPGSVELIGCVASLISRNSHRKIKEQFYRAHWEIGFLESNQTLNPIYFGDIQIIPSSNSSRYYLADPFPVIYDGNEYVFAEEFDKEKKLGRIVCIEHNQSPASVIEEEWHLSYPFYWEERGDHFIIPESGESGKLFIYQAHEFPKKWQRLGVFFSGEAYDPTLWKTKEGYWLFVNQKPHPECSPFDELYLYFSESLLNPVWTSHPMNPIVSDVRCSRPAGKIYEENGKLYRPAQDSGLRYGHQVQVQEITELSLTQYSERVAFTVSADEEDEILGIHTFNKSGNKIYLDLYFRK